MKKITRNDGQDHLIYREGSGGTVEIFDIVVNSERMKGVGRSMIKELVSQVDTHLIFAITRSTNTGAQRFYSKVGFVLVAQLRRFYEEEDAIMFAYRIRRQA